MLVKVKEAFIDKHGLSEGDHKGLNAVVSRALLRANYIRPMPQNHGRYEKGDLVILIRSSTLYLVNGEDEIPRDLTHLFELVPSQGEDQTSLEHRTDDKPGNTYHV